MTSLTACRLVGARLDPDAAAHAPVGGIDLADLDNGEVRARQRHPVEQDRGVPARGGVLAVQLQGGNRAQDVLLLVRGAHSGGVPPPLDPPELAPSDQDRKIVRGHAHGPGSPEVEKGQVAQVRRVDSRVLVAHGKGAEMCAWGPRRVFHRQRT